MAGGDVSSPREERHSWEMLSSGRWLRVPGGGLGSHGRWWVHTMQVMMAFPVRSAVDVALETPHDLPFSAHLRAFHCWRWKMQKAVTVIMLIQNPGVLVQSFLVQAFP